MNTVSQPTVGIPTICGIDVGRSATKVVAASGNEARRLVFPSAVCQAIALSIDSSAALAANDTVDIEGAPYFTGQTALLQGRDELLGGLSDDWTATPGHRALLMSAVKRLVASGVPGVESGVIVVGLPGRVFAGRRRAYRAELAQLLPNARILVVPQPLGPFYTKAIDPKGNEQAESGMAWAVIEVGQFTTDYAVVEGGHVLEHALGSTDGMRIAAEALQRLVQAQYSVNLSLAEATNLLAEPAMKVYGTRVDVSELVAKAVQPLARSILDKARQLFGESMRGVDGVLLAGGGAPLIHKALESTWPSSMAQIMPQGFFSVVEDSRFAVAEGFTRFGLLSEYARRSMAEAA